MIDGRWIRVPCDGGGDHDWTGRVWREGIEMPRWRFEMVRHAPQRDMLSTAPVGELAPVACRLGMTLPSTLLGAFATAVEPGLVDDGGTTRVEGSFGALLAGLVVVDESVEAFLGFSCASDTFACWYGGRGPEVRRDGAGSTVIAAGTREVETVVVPGLGTVEAVRRPRLVEGDASAGLRLDMRLSVSFDRPRSVADVMQWCIGAELLFGLLCGARLVPPTFRLERSAEAGDDGARVSQGNLDVSGMRHTQQDAPHPFSRIHMCGRGGVGLCDVLTAFAGDRDGFMSRIGAIDEGRRSGSTLNVRFSTVMPLLEKAVKARFVEPEEARLLAWREAFFEWVDACPETSVGEFCRKHVEVVNFKPPSLKVQLERCFATLSGFGFRLPAGLARALARRRAAAFHSVPIDSEDQVRQFDRETRAATLALLLLTLDDLGVALAPLSEAHHALPDFDDFLRSLPGTAGDRSRTDP